jgi:hypothetical protein
MIKYNTFLRRCLGSLLSVLYLQSTFAWADVYMDFLGDGEIAYSFSKPTRKTEIQVDLDWEDIEKTIKGNKTSFFRAWYSQDEGFYELEPTRPISETDDIHLRISRDISVRFKGNLKCHSLTLREAELKWGGTFINLGNISFTDTDKNIKNSHVRRQRIEKYGLHLEDASYFKNRSQVTFESSTLLSLGEGFLTNTTEGTITFNQRSRIVEHNIGILKDNFLLFEDDNFTSLVNKGRIQGLQELGLFAKSFISDTGRIQANPIVMDWNGQRKIAFQQNLSNPVPLTTEDKTFPIRDIVRIPNTLRQEHAGDVGELGEATARYFYATFMKRESFSHKANSQENGIDVISYTTRSPKKLIIHESKNYRDSGFGLRPNQMTESWIYAYLFKMYQDFLKESLCILKTGHRHLPEASYVHLQEILSNILAEKPAKTVKTISAWIKTKKPPENQKHIVGVMEGTKNKKAALMELQDYKQYFIADLQIIARGNSIVHCELPTTNAYGFNQTTENFKAPTYFIRRDLSKTFSQRGFIPQSKG